MTAEELLKKGLEELKIPHTEKEIEQVLFFLDELEKWNSRINLVKAGRIEIVTNHILDSLAGLPLLSTLPQRRNLLDIGSGAGFPGIPLAIFLPDTPVTLCDTQEKRTAFLRSIKYLLPLKNVHVVHNDYKKLKEKFDVVTFRAFTQLDTEIKSLRNLLTRDGSIFAYKGKRDKIDEELKVIKSLQPPVDVRIETLEVPFIDRERHMVIISRKP